MKYDNDGPKSLRDHYIYLPSKINFISVIRLVDPCGTCMFCLKHAVCVSTILRLSVEHTNIFLALSTFEQ